ncbi:hypothetical protein [Streptomyces sp. NPDC003032]
MHRKTSSVCSYAATAKRKVGAVGYASLVDLSYDLGLITLPAREVGEVHLAPRQRQLVPLIAQNLNYQQLAEKTGSPLPQVRRDLGRLMTVLGARTRAHLVTRARQYDLHGTHQGTGLTEGGAQSVEEKLRLLAGKALHWDLRTEDLPQTEHSLAVIQFLRQKMPALLTGIRYDLARLPQGAPLRPRVHATLAEADRRLLAAPVVGGRRPAALRAQNLARLAEAIVRAAVAVREEVARRPATSAGT